MSGVEETRGGLRESGAGGGGGGAEKAGARSGVVMGGFGLGRLVGGTGLLWGA